MMNLLLSMILSFAIMFLMLNHPLSFGLILLVQTMLVALVSGMMNYNFWFSYILFLIMVGGMLILFIYMTSVASNEKFKFTVTALFPLSLGLTIWLMSIFFDKLWSNLKLMNSETSNNQMEFLSLSKYLMFPNNLILSMVIIYLLITLIMVVKITNISKGPLRQMF